MKRDALVDLLTNSPAPVRVCLIDTSHVQLAAHGLLNDQELRQKISELVVPDAKRIVLAKKYLVPLFTSSESTCGFVILSIKVTAASCIKSSAPVTSEPLQPEKIKKGVEFSSSYGFIPEPSSVETEESTGQVVPISLERPIQPLVPPPPPLYFTSQSYNRQELSRGDNTVLKQTLVQCWKELLASKSDYTQQQSSTPQHRLSLEEETRLFDVPVTNDDSAPSCQSGNTVPFGSSTHFGYPMLSALYNELSKLHTGAIGTHTGANSIGIGPRGKDTRSQSTQTVADPDPSSPTAIAATADAKVNTAGDHDGKGKRKFVRTCCKLHVEHQSIKLKDVNADFRAVIKKVKKRKPCSMKTHPSTKADRVMTKPPIDRKGTNKTRKNTERSSHANDKENQDKMKHGSASKASVEGSSSSDSGKQSSSHTSPSDTTHIDSHSTYDINNARVPNNSCTSLRDAKHPLGSAASTGSFEGTSLDNTQSLSLDDTRGTFLDRSTLGQKVYLASSLHSQTTNIASDSTSDMDDKDVSASYDNDTSYLQQLPKGLSSLSVSDVSSSHKQSPPTTTPSDVSSLHHDDDAIKDGTDDDDDISDIEEQMDDSGSYSDDFEDASP